ncbi:hypothetical protein ABBQ38_012071 [Trebouxia sp. C0009 RCD-2024]
MQDPHISTRDVTTSKCLHALRRCRSQAPLTHVTEFPLYRGQRTCRARVNCASDGLDEVTTMPSTAGTTQRRQEDTVHEGVQDFHQQAAVGVPPLIPLVPLQPSRTNTMAGFVWALVILGAVRLGRQQAEDTFLDYDAIREARQQRLESDKEMYARRLQLAKVEAQQKAEEASKRITTARRRTEEAEKRQQEKEARYKREAEREAVRLSAIRDAEKRAFEEKEAQAAAELQQRVEIEQRTIAEQQRRARAELERQRREAEERRQAAVLEKQRAAEAREQELVAQRAQREAERQALRRLQKSFAVRVEGSVTIDKAPKGSVTPGRIPREATLQLAVEMSTALTSETTASELYRDTGDASSGAVELAGKAAAAVVDQYHSALRLQNMTGQGALQHMGEPEAQHWMRMACCRSLATCAGSLQGLLQSHGQKAAGQTGAFQVRTEYGVLPADHPKRTEAQLDLAVAMLEAGNTTSCADSVLKPMMEQNDQAFYQGLPAPAPQHVGSVLTLAHFLDHMYHHRPAKRVEASPWYESATSLVQQLITQTVQDAPKDSLMPLAQYMQHALGHDHTVTNIMLKLADANLSTATKARQQEQQRLQEAELAAQLLEEEWPDEDEVRAARMAVREEATPVPERAWALRNVASTLALGGPGERARARTLLEKAVTLKEQWLDDKEHPGLLVELDALSSVLESSAEWRADAGAIRARMLRILSLVASRFLSAGETASAVVVLESAVRQYEDILGIRHPGISTLSKKAEKLLENLEPEQREQVSTRCRQAAGIVQQIIQTFAEKPDVYKQATGKRRSVDLWSEGGLGTLQPFL